MIIVPHIENRGKIPEWWKHKPHEESAKQRIFRPPKSSKNKKTEKRWELKESKLTKTIQYRNRSKAVACRRGRRRVLLSWGLAVRKALYLHGVSPLPLPPPPPRPPLYCVVDLHLQINITKCIHGTYICIIDRFCWFAETNMKNLEPFTINRKHLEMKYWVWWFDFCFNWSFFEVFLKV